MKIRIVPSLLALALPFLLAASPSAAVETEPPPAPAGALQGYQRLPRTPAPASPGAGKGPTLGVALHDGQLIHSCPGSAPNPSQVLAAQTGRIELDGLCKALLAQPGGPRAATAPTRGIEPGAALVLVDPDTASLGRDNGLDLRAHGQRAHVAAVRDTARGRYLLIAPGETARSFRGPLHFVLDQQGRFVGFNLAADGSPRSPRLVIPHEALSSDPKLLLQAGTAFPELADLVESLAFERSRDWHAMAQHARRWLRTANANGDAWLALAIAADNTGDRRDAIEAYENVIERAPGHPHALTRLAPLYADNGRIEAAADTYRKALQAAPDSALLHRGLGMALVRLAAYHEAIEHLERATALDALDKLAWNALGLAYRGLMQASEASEAFRRAIELDDAFYGAWLNLAVLEHEKGDRASAHATYAKAAQRDPSSPVPWFGRGLLHAETGELAQEIEAYRHALQIKPDDTRSLYNLGKASLLDGRISAAIDTYETLRRLQPDHVNALFNLGLAYFLDRQADKVEQVHRLILRLSPSEAEIFYLRFMAPVDRHLAQEPGDRGNARSAH